MSKYDFALQWLEFLGNSIYNKGKRILKYKGKPDYKIAPLQTGVKYGIDFDDDEEVSYQIMSFKDFDNLGYAIKRNTDILWKPRQRCSYSIMRKTYDSLGLTYEAFKSARLQIQHDPTHRRFRLIGENVIPGKESSRPDSGVGDWVVYDDDAPKTKTGRKPSPKIEDMRSYFMRKMYDLPDDNVEYIAIKEIPVMISDERYIVCIKRQDTCQRIIVVGESGQGKSLCVNALSGRIFYKWQDRVGWLIDPLNQLQDLSAPQDFSDFIKVNNYINDEPKPLPVIQLYMACRNRINIRHKNISLLLTQNFVELINKFKFYSYGIDDWVIKGSTRYLYQYSHRLKNIQNREEFMKEMFECMPTLGKDENLQRMVSKWAATFAEVCKEKFTSNMYRDNPLATDELTIEFKDGRKLNGHPFIMLMEAGLIPVLNISSAIRQRWLRNYLADLMRKIVSHQMNRAENCKRFWIIADELNSIYEVGKKKDNAYSAFEELFRQGRVNNIGFIGNTQSLEKLNPEMYGNATHICSFYIKKSKDRKILKDTFDLSKETYDVLGRLKKYEMIIFKNPSESFVIYNKWGRRKEIKDRNWFKGKILPPINYHYVPSAKSKK